MDAYVEPDRYQVTNNFCLLLCVYNLYKNCRTSMEQNILYRPAAISDLEGLIKVGDQLFDNPIKPDRATEFLNDPRHHLILALHDHEVVGMASGFHYVHPDKDPALFIDEVGVVEEYQSKGIGRQLVSHLCMHGKSLGCSEAWVVTDQSNVAARKAYAAAGGTEDDQPIVLIDLKLDSSD